MTVLFVDDDLLFIEPWKEACEEAGYQCHVVTNPDTALEWLSQNRSSAQAAIIDIMLPRGSFSKEQTDSGLLTGLALAERIRDLYKSSIPVIFLSIRNDINGHAQKANVRALSKIQNDPSDLVRVLDGTLPRNNQIQDKS